MVKRWLFTGAGDKRDLILYSCKILALSGNKVLLVDLSDGRIYRYLTRSGIEELVVTEYNGFDITSTAVHPDHEAYDYCLYDIGMTTRNIDGLLESADQIIWGSSHDRCELGRSIEWLRDSVKRYSQLAGREMQIVFIRTLDYGLDKDYVLGLLEEIQSIGWKERIITIPWSEGNEEIRLLNEHSGSLRMRHLSKAYKHALLELLGELTEWSMSEAKGALRLAERRGA